MSDDAVRDLARRAGIAVEWHDYKDAPRQVSVEVLRHILSALSLPCASLGDLAESRRALEASRAPLLPLVTAEAGKPIMLPVAGADLPPRVRLVREDGIVDDLLPRPGLDGSAMLPAIDVTGYHVLELGGQRITLAIAPPRCCTITDLAPGARPWALAVQLYGLRRPGDGGIGDVSAVAALASSAAALKADALALSPMHALFAADAGHFSPYAPSNRLLYNPLHADPRALFSAARVAKALAGGALDVEARGLEAHTQIDWPRAARVKLALLRRLFDDFSTADLSASPPTPLAADFARFRAAGGELLEEHARFEALHAARLAADRSAWSWRSWPAEWRDPRSAALADFAAKHEREILFHCFLQWIADRSLAATQAQARQAGMRIGLIADLAVGMSGAGSHAWARQDDILVGLKVGAPPDLFNALGQDWGLTTISPRALVTGGFSPFIATLRAGMRHAGGLRIDHAMGFMRLWVIPDGAAPGDGAYLAYPLDDLLRLTALESHRHRAIVIGEDLGTVPPGFRDRLAGAGIAGMRVLFFERERNRFVPPPTWPRAAVAMTSTHDLPTVAGWWRGSDIAVRAQCGVLPDRAQAQAERRRERAALWRAFRSAKVAEGPRPAAKDAPRVVEAAVRFVARTPAELVLLPLEDALSLDDQPNVPGTIDEHPNWRRRYPADADAMLDRPDVRARLEPLIRRAQP